MPRASRSRLMRVLLRVVRPVWKNRRVALWSEEYFWRRWISKSPDLLTAARDPKRPFPPNLVSFLEQIGRRRVDVLEVGSGVIGPGHWHPDFEIHFVRTDVLADRYNRLLERHGIKLPFPVIQADAETLVAQFGAESFDLVHATNCLDHMERPVLAVTQMVAVTRPGGFVVMRHEIDEGAHQDYAGLHQWNLRAEDGRFIIWNEAERHDVTALLADSCDVLAEVQGDLLYTEIRKRRVSS